MGTALSGAAACATAGLWYQLFRRPLPRTKGRLRLTGLDGTVEIRRDRWGVPHIRAAAPHDLWFGEGFCHGQDRLWQIDLYRRIGSGRLSEIAGRVGLRTDRFMRTLGLRRAAEREEAALDSDLRPQLEAFCAGVNAAAADRRLPAELQILRLDFEPFRPVDQLLLTKLLSFGLSTNWERELLRAEMTRELAGWRRLMPSNCATGRSWSPASPGRAMASRSPSRSRACGTRWGWRSRLRARTTGRSAACAPRPEGRF